MQEDSEKLIDKTYVIVTRLEEKAKMFGNGMLALSILDCLFGLLAIFCTSLTLTAFFASATSLTAITICGRIIQIKKIQQLEKALKPLNLVAIAWFVNKYKKYLKSKKGAEKEVKTEKLSGIQIASIVGAVVGIIFAIVSVFVPQIAIAGDSLYNILISTGIEGVCAFAGTFKGYKKRTEEEIAKIKEKQAEKAQKAIDKEALKEIKNAEKLANQTKEQQEKAQKKAEEEAIAKAEVERLEAEHRAKVEEAKARLIAEQQNKTE